MFFQIVMLSNLKTLEVTVRKAGRKSGERLIATKLFSSLLS